MHRQALILIAFLLSSGAPAIADNEQYIREQQVRDGRLLVVNISQQFSETGLPQ